MVSMSKWESKSITQMIEFLELLGYSPQKSDEWQEKGPDSKKENIRAGFSKYIFEPQYLVLDKTNTQKAKFLEIFENRGWQPQLKKQSVYGPRAGSVNQVDASGVPVSTIWEIKDFDTTMDIIGEAELLAEVGKGGNDWIYIWSGYMAFWPDGWSNMALIEWFKEGQDPIKGETGEDDGQILYGEDAFRRLQELRTLPEEEELLFYASINRWVID